MAEGSDVDLEEGELLTSDEEEPSDKEPPVITEVKQSSPKPLLTSEPIEEGVRNSLNTQSSIDPISDDGEIYSDDEESAYFPNQVKSRPAPKHQKPEASPRKKRVSRWSENYQSPNRAKDHDGKNHRNSPERQGKHPRSDSSDHDRSDDSSDRRLSRDKDRQRESPLRHWDSPARSNNQHSSPDSKPSYQNRNSPGPQRQKWSRRGGYGSSSPYQSQGHPRYGRNRGGGNTNKRFQYHTGMTEAELHILSLEVPQRKEKGLSLLPNPKFARNTRIDLSIYPPPPTWYLRELKAWDAMHKPKKITASSVRKTTPNTQPSTYDTPLSIGAATATESAQSLSTVSIPPPIVPVPVPLMSSLVRLDSNTRIDTTESNPPLSQVVDSKVHNTANQVVVDDTPLDPSMPFAQPLPSSNVPFATSLIPPPQSVPLPDKTEPLTDPTEQNSSVSDTSSQRELPVDLEPLGEGERMVNCDRVNDVMAGTSLTERTVSVSSEVMMMEIDLSNDRQSQTPDQTTPTTPTLPHQLATPTPPPHTPVTDTQPALSHNKAQGIALTDQPSDSQTTHNPVSSRSTFSISSPEVPTLLTLPNLQQNLEEPNSYNQQESLEPNLQLREETASEEEKPLETKHTEVMDIDDEEIDYDTYLDQLDDEEAPVTDSLTLSNLLQSDLPKIEDDLFSQDFPIIDQSSTPGLESNERGSLMALVGEEEPMEKSRSGVKSTKKKEKELTWKAKQRLRQSNSKEPPEKSPRPPCKYFMNGICKNGDSCAYSHEGPRVKKKEICKFYKQDTCNKGADCLYYHGEFPCKFFHIKLYCRNGDNCKFSHAPLNAETEALLATVAGSVTPPCNTPLHTVPPSPQPPLTPQPLPTTTANERVQITEEGIHIKMFGSTEPIQSSGLVVSIPKSFTTEELLVSIPLSKIKLKMKLRRIPKKAGQSTAPPSSTVAPAPTWDSDTPTPLFSSSSFGDPTKGQHQHPPRRFLLPTPPPHTKLTPEDFKRMENMPHEYWEAPGLSEPHLPSHPHGRPQWRPPYEQGYRSQPSYPPRHRPSFNQPPMPPPPPHPDQYWNPPPPSQWHGSRMELGPGDLNRPPDAGPSGWNQKALSGGFPGPRMDPRAGGMDQRPPGGTEQRPSGMDLRSSGMDPRYMGNEPRHTGADPRFTNQSDPRSSSSSQAPVYHPPGSKWSQPLRTEQQGVLSPPSYTTQHGSMSPPLSTDRQSQGWSKELSPSWRSERASSSWGTSPDYSTSNKGAADANKRLDPRKKYSHFKIKSKNSTSSLDQQLSLKKETPQKVGPSYKIPKLLTDSTSLDKPIDPKELFGSDGMDTTLYGEITFGTYKSPFTQNSDNSNRTDVISTNDHNTASNEQTPTCEDRTTNSTGQDTSVPSYLAHIDSGLGGGGLEIESAFGSLSEKKDDEGSKDKSQESQARKLPSVFGFGL